MDIGIVILILVSLAVGWSLGIATRQKMRDEVKRSNAELEGVRRMLGLAGEQVGSLENKLLVTTGDYEQRLTAVYGQLDQAALGVDRVLSMFPYIEDVNSLMTRMSPEDFKKLDLPFGAEFQAGMTQLAGQKMEAIVKLNEAGLRLALGMHYLKQTGATIAPNTKFVAELLLQQRDLMVEYAPEMQMPAFKQQYAEFMAINMARVNAAYRNGEERPDPKLVGLCLQAIDEAYAEFQVQADEAGALPKPEQTPRVSASPETLIMPAPVGVYTASANGNGSHKG